MNHIFNDDDILDEWTRGEEPILSSDNLDLLDQDLPAKKGREAARAGPDIFEARGEVIK